MLGGLGCTGSAQRCGHPAMEAESAARDGFRSACERLAVERGVGLGPVKVSSNEGFTTVLLVVSNPGPRFVVPFSPNNGG